MQLGQVQGCLLGGNQNELSKMVPLSEERAALGCPRPQICVVPKDSVLVAIINSHDHHGKIFCYSRRGME